MTSTESFTDRIARAAREEFARIKAAAKTETEIARVEAYEAYRASVTRSNETMGTSYNPHPYKNFKWKECVLCHTEIRDDPFGHNPAPLVRSGQCCSSCNTSQVLRARR